jgi:hypothetical protein
VANAHLSMPKLLGGILLVWRWKSDLSCPRGLPSQSVPANLPFLGFSGRLQLRGPHKPKTETEKNMEPAQPMCRFPKNKRGKRPLEFWPSPYIAANYGETSNWPHKKKRTEVIRGVVLGQIWSFFEKKLGNFCAILSSVKTTRISILAPNFRYKKFDYKKNLSLIKLHLNLWFLFITNNNFLAIRSAGVTLPSRHRRSPN